MLRNMTREARAFSIAISAWLVACAWLVASAWLLIFFAGCVGMADAEKTATLLEGTTLHGTLQNRVSSEKSGEGDPVSVRLTQPVALAAGKAIPAGTVVQGELTEVAPTANGEKAALTLAFRELVLPSGGQASIDAEPIRVVARESGAEDKAEKIALGGIAGAVIGGVAGGAKGMIAGTVTGIGAGAVVALATDNGVLTLEPGTPVAIQIVENAKVPLPKSADS